MIRRTLGATCVIGAVALLGLRRTTPSELRVSIDSAYVLSLDIGISTELERALGARRPAQAQWQDAVGLYVTGDSSAGPVDGQYEIADGRVVFTPYFPLVPGIAYQTVIELNRLRAVVGLPFHPSGGRRIERLFIPAKPIIRRTTVAAVYPTADRLPANLLRFYVVFSRPMREGDAAHHLYLLDDDGHVVEHAFLGLETELWDASRRRLTVLLDPGRIKRGLRPNRELGPPLVAGRGYRLRADSTWRDADGAMLLDAYEKTFIAVDADRQALAANSWQTTPPEAGSLDAIVVRAPRPLDYALVHRLIHVTDSAGTRVAVAVTTTDNERTVRLTPSAPWTPGLKYVVVAAEVEDVAGNSLQRPFDVDLTDSLVRRDDKLSSIRISVSIRP